MTAALALLLGALAAGRVAAALLGRIDLTRVDPLAVLTGRLLSAAGVLAATVAGVALLLFPGHGNGTSMASAIHGCLEALSHGRGRLGGPRLRPGSGASGVARGHRSRHSGRHTRDGTGLCRSPAGQARNGKGAGRAVPAVARLRWSGRRRGGAPRGRRFGPAARHRDGGLPAVG